MYHKNFKYKVSCQGHGTASRHFLSLIKSAGEQKFQYFIAVVEYKMFMKMSLLRINTLPFLHLVCKNIGQH